MSCAACSTVVLKDEECLQCTLKECSKIYHLLCAGGRKSPDSTSAWVCPECRCAAKKGGDNTKTPVGASKKLRDTNVTYRKKTPTSAGTDEPKHIQTDLMAKTPTASKIKENQNISETDLPSEIRSLRQEMSALRDQLSNAVTIIRSYESKLECYATQVQSLHEKINKNENSHRPQPTVASPACSTASPTVSKQKKITKQTAQVETSPSRSTPKIGTKDSDILISSAITKSVITINADAQSVSNTQGVSSMNDQHEKWTEVRKRSRRPPSLCGTAGPSVTSLKAVEARSFIHLWNMMSSADEIRSYLGQLCPSGICTVEELTPRGNYKSYKLEVPAAYNVTCLSPDVWPINARIKAWITYKQPTGLRKSTQNNQPFHGPAATR